MIFESLHRLQAEADLLIMYPLLAQARDLYKAKLVPIQVKTFRNGHDPTWQDSYTKLLAFNQTQYKRVISLDSDATVLQWKRVENATDHHESSDYDIDILNKLYGSSCLIIPHQRYDVLTGEFKSENHENYLGFPDEKWNAHDIFTQPSFIHFSDWPTKKPWLEVPEEEIRDYQPRCRVVSETDQDCSDRDVWRGIRKDFTERRQRVCGHAFDKRSIDRRSESPMMSTRPRYESTLV
ncbi:glycosyltransferase family 8 protein [Pleomassaria siparia CBS 279.74]|uniref:Glycosyltransferase family 8 protein n=1 Tax=Pleomassaria siparia CBS 279.74 TaxID=1314801 RepID=A0A6G1KSQ8_9PLEO|nr:glycosyltransferase family 8 protein [Pleomassaria siparia CBS 279.74]